MTVVCLPVKTMDHVTQVYISECRLFTCQNCGSRDSIPVNAAAPFLIVR